MDIYCWNYCINFTFKRKYIYNFSSFSIIIFYL